MDSHSIESMAHSTFCESRCRSFVGRTALFKSILEQCDCARDVLVLAGVPGSGKSSLTAVIARALQREAIQSRSCKAVVSHFVGASPASVNCCETLGRICVDFLVSSRMQTLIDIN
jgi:energy-coupling factor transporter ATP-binding protein EcfA2